MKASNMCTPILNLTLAIFAALPWTSAQASSKIVDGLKRGGVRGSFQAVMHNPSVDANRTVLNELLGADGPTYSWPAFPRVWHQIERGRNQEAITSLGGSLPAGVGSATGKIALTYTYGQKTSLVVLSSLRKSQAEQGDQKEVSVEPVDLNQMTTFDGRTNQRYFNVSEEYPMVGFCTYEMSLKIAKAAHGGIVFLGVGQSLEISDYQAETITMYSNFFQIKGDLSVQDYMKTKCEDHFLLKAKPFVEDDFERIVVEYYSLYNPKNQCKLGGKSSELGDESCMLWHQYSVRPATRNSTVPRCEVQPNGQNKCVLKAKKGASCPLYRDRNMKISDTYQGQRSVTLTSYAYSCDEGLACGMDRKPVGFGSLVLWPGAATCK